MKLKDIRKRIHGNVIIYGMKPLEVQEDRSLWGPVLNFFNK